MVKGFAAAMVLLVMGSAPALGASRVLESPAARVSLLELYTSEGCSSCPPADRWLGGLVDDPRLWREFVPVAFHVDYWDYIGWPDRFASPEYSNRQRLYARTASVRTVYTPGFVLDGREWSVWFGHRRLELGDSPAVGPLRVELANGSGQATFRPTNVTGDGLELHLALTGFDLSTQVQGGENSGRTLSHNFVVLGYRRVPLVASDGGFQAKFQLPAARVAARRTALAAWVSRRGDPRPIQSVGGWLPR